MKSLLTTAVLFGIAAVVLLGTMGFRFYDVIALAIDRQVSSDAYAKTQDAENSRVFKSLNAALGIELFVMRLLFYTCLFCMAISSICSCVAMRKAFKSDA